jgi:hypothetical protein
MFQEPRLNFRHLRQTSVDFFGAFFELNPIFAILFLRRSKTRLALENEFHRAVYFFRCHVSSVGVEAKGGLILADSRSLR